MQNIYERVCKWNSKRYDRVYDHNLTIQLLIEEYQEWLEAESKVDELDALCDIVYVAFGAIWKLDITDEEMQFGGETAYESCMGFMQTDTCWPGYMVRVYIDQLIRDNTITPAVALWHIVQFAMVQMTSLGLTMEECLKALDIVCDSNDSKTVEKTSPDVKANLDKGAFFVAPEPRLTKLLEQANARFS